MSNEFDNDRDFLAHYGTPRHSGRYPWGSGKNPQRSSGFISRVQYYRDNGYGDTEIAKMEGISTTEFRKRMTIAKAESRSADYAMANRLKEKGMSNVAIGKRMGKNESYIRTLLKDGVEEKVNKLNATVNILKDSVDEKKYIDVSAGVSRYMEVPDATFKAAVKQLVDSGDYDKKQIHVKQIANPNQYTNTDVLVKAGTKLNDIYENMEKVSLPVEYLAEGNSKKRTKLHEPINVDGSRVMVRYGEDDGALKEGVMELRRGVQDLDMGNSRYAQVRIGVKGFKDEYHPDYDDTPYYLKGMAVYGDDKDFPPGVDIIFNSMKSHDLPMEKVFKKQKLDDPTNPFGASILRQNDSTDPETGEKRADGALNIVSEEGKWSEWSKTIASQVLSKQPVDLARKQLKLAEAEADEEYETIMSLTNPVLKRQMLEQFADGCDADAVDLKAAALPRQASHVILPVTTLKNNEIYAPNYEDGEEVVLIRYPHGGRFEIPRLKVNNKNKEGKALLGENPIDAVGINSKVAEQLSGADFDGDTVLVIPTKGVKIKNQSPLEELKGFDAKVEYGGYDKEHPNFRLMTEQMKGREMGSITNLITDMTLLGADNHEIARAVKHSQVVIDAVKHQLNFEQSYTDNNIAELKTKYQGGPRAGASTLISKATSEQRVPDRQKYGIDPETGEIIWRDKSKTYTKTVYKGRPNEHEVTVTETPIKSTKMYEALLHPENGGAYALSSGHEMENVYADYANYMHALANKARKSSLNVGEPTWNRGATTVAYKAEIKSLDEKLNKALKNAPLERKAQMVANKDFETAKLANPDRADDKDWVKKTKTRCLNNARDKVGAGKEQIKLTDREWEAIQAGAVSKTKQVDIFKNCDQDVLKQRAMPKSDTKITSATATRIRAMLDSGWTNAELAEKFGVSTTTISNIKKGVV